MTRTVGTLNGFGAATFELKLERVVVKKGTVFIKFSQQPNATNYGTS